ncbi:unnamed protein product [Penicillium egyptiacum]|uniref:Uncharacterized protein n=1 Tax=Penicillium egyptiacum TaxID=1303716 RepID=A0A9W4KGI0_9EURO|nr:unnamed protein product [Penicillium egyptiacum]
MYGSYFRSSDLILHVGPMNIIEGADIALFEAKTAATVTFNRNSVVIGDQKYELFSRPVLQQILNCLSERKLRDLSLYLSLPNFRDSIDMLLTRKKTGRLQYDIYCTFWRRMSPFFRAGDIILTEARIAQDGARCFVLPRDTSLINTGARKLPRHMLATTLVLFEEAKGFKKAHNDLRAILDKKLNLIIFVINDGAPIIESLMHIMKYQRQDSDPWRYSESVSFFGAPQKTSYPVSITIARTWGDFDIIIHDKMIQSGIGLHIVEFMSTPEIQIKARLFLLKSIARPRALSP